MADTEKAQKRGLAFASESVKKKVGSMGGKAPHKSRGPKPKKPKK